MGDQVQRALEETVPLLRQIRRLKLLSENEIVSLVRERRDHEYALIRPGAPRAAFLRYAAFERDLSEKLKSRAAERNVPEKRARSIVARQAARINLVYSRAIRKFKGDDALYLHYAKHCISNGSRKAAQKVFARAIAHRGDSEKVWLAAMAFHFDSCGDPKVARAIAQRGLRTLKRSTTLWKEYFRLELAFLTKLIARRITIGQWPLAENNGKPSADHVGSTVQNEEIEMKRATCSFDDARHNDLHAQSTGESRNVRFWDGGVPFAAFRNACDVAAISDVDACHMIQIAASMQFVPPCLLQALGEYCESRFGSDSGLGLRMLLIRNKFDTLAAHLFLVRNFIDANKSSAQTPEDASHSVPFISHDREMGETSLETAAEAAAFDALSECKRVVTKSQIKLSEDNLCLSILKDFAQSAKNLLRPKVVECLVEKFDELHDDWQPSGASEVAQGDSVDFDKARNSTSPEVWQRFLRQRDIAGEMCCDVDENLVRDTLRQICVVPFRSKDHQQISLEWLRWEKDISRVREAYDLLLSLPPDCDEIMRGAIMAEDRLHASSPVKNFEQFYQRSRRLYLRRTALPSAGNNLQLWLDFLKFEKIYSKNAGRISDAIWKAKKRLPAALYTAFEEQVTLSNLV